MLKKHLGLAFLLFLSSLVSCGRGSKKSEGQNHQNQERSEKLELKAITFNNTVKDSVRGKRVTGIIITVSHQVEEDQLKEKAVLSKNDGTFFDFSVSEIGANTYLLSPAGTIAVGEEVILTIDKTLASVEELALSSAFSITVKWPPLGEMYSPLAPDL